MGKEIKITEQPEAYFITPRWQRIDFLRRAFPATVLLDFGTHTCEVRDIIKATVEYGNNHCVSCQVVGCTAKGGEEDAPNVQSVESFNSGKPGTASSLSPSDTYRVAATFIPDFSRSHEDFRDLAEKAKCKPIFQFGI